MALGFGTSGVRGLVTELTDRECARYVRAFIRHVRDRGGCQGFAIAGDFRSSTPRLLRAAAWAIAREGATADHCGRIPTPALVHHAMQHGQACLMVTGSHIPDDRNGIKFNLPWGEVLKPDEAGIAAHHAALQDEMTSPDLASVFGADAMFLPGTAPVPGPVNPAPVDQYLRRYLDFFPAGCLAGRHVVVYEHSSVARDLLGQLLENLGAQVTRVARSERFIPVDTEAVQNPAELAAWVREHQADALVSADGDGDRPLVVDGEGAVVRGDVLGILVAAFLHADAVAAPVSCNTALEKSGLFPRVLRTRIGSPFVVAALQQAAADGARCVAGFEANGGFLLASDVTTGTARLAALPTRDAALPILAVLQAAGQRGLSLAQLVRTLPPRTTCSGLLRPFPTDQGRALVAELQSGGLPAVARLFEPRFGPVKAVNYTDGVRATFASGDIVHIRPSGNAPEFRVYTESNTPEGAAAANDTAMAVVRSLAVSAT